MPLPRQSHPFTLPCLVSCLLFGIMRHAGAQDDPISSFHLLTPTTGWALVGNKLLWTEQNGKDWQDRTPKLSSNQTITSVFFLNSTSGWVLLGTQPTTGTFTSFSPESTTDAGKTWTKTAPLQVSPDLLPVLSRLTFLTFFDAKHGWLELQLASSSNFKYGLLFATQNGGATWSELPRPPVVDQMDFISPTVGWIAGGPAGDSLYRTTDGGKSWQAQTLPVPPGTADAKRPQYSKPSFSNSNDGILPVTYLGTNDDPYSSFAVYTTSNGGNSWSQKSFEKLSVIGTVPSSAYDSAIIRAFATGNSFVIGSHMLSRPLASTGLSDLTIDAISFVDQYNGWLKASGDSCTSGPNCQTPTKLFATTDGGQSLTDITPSAALAVAESTQRQISEASGRAFSDERSVRHVQEPRRGRASKSGSADGQPF